MNKERIIQLIRSLSMAVVGQLCKMDLSIGEKSTGLSALDEALAIRSTIAKTNVDLRLAAYENVVLNTKSFLNTITASDLDGKRFNGYDKQIADIIGVQMGIVKNELFPDVNKITDLFLSKAGELENINFQNMYDVTFLSKPSIFTSMIDTNEFEVIPKTLPSLTETGYSFPTLTSFDQVKAIISNSNPLVNAEITALLNTQPDDYWVDLYNVVFGSISDSNGLLLSFNTSRFSNFTKAIFCYLVARTFMIKIPFIVPGNAETVRVNVDRVYNYLKHSIVTTGNLFDTLTDSGVLILGNTNKSIVVNKTLFKDLTTVDVDVIIGAAMEDKTDLKSIVTEAERLKASFNNVNSDYIVSETKKRVEKLRAILMSVIDEQLITDEKLSPFRGEISRYIYALDESDLSKPKSLISNILIKTKYADTNCDYITSRMKAYATQDDSNMDKVAEYAAIDLVAKYLIDTHCILS